MDTTEILRQLAIIVLAAKFFGLVARKIKAPMVVGEIAAGLIIGPSMLGLLQSSDFLQGMAEIGVIMLMFSAGLNTDIKELKETGVKSTVIACAGVFVPLILGTVLYMCFYGFSGPGTTHFLKAVFIGTILTATSVSITVQTLKEMGKLSDSIGTTIMSAAIIDDVIGIIVLTVVIGFRDPNAKIWDVVFHTFLFFVFSIGVGIITYHVFKRLDKRYPHTRRIPIMGMALAFILAWIAAEFFGVADITGAYIAGVILSSLDDSAYISRKMDVNSYMLFGPVFFCSIGLQTNIRNVNMSVLVFSLAFVVVGLLSKIIGCTGASLGLGYSMNDSLKIGLGMMTRGEVALIVAQRGLAAGLLDQTYFTSVILLIIASSIITPILLKIVYSKDPSNEKAPST
ncbi:MAG: cation:proton antiporter [Lachnospiraceae bacterium]|nr:cation:proton antiporter [Lachnospiraceae bacterium]